MLILEIELEGIFPSYLRMINKLISILILAISAFLWGYFEGKLYTIAKNNGEPKSYILPILFLLVSAVFYALGIIAKPMNLGLWVSLWEIGAFVAAVKGATNFKISIFHEGVFVGWIFIGMGAWLLAKGWDLLYDSYLPF